MPHVVPVTVGENWIVLGELGKLNGIESNSQVIVCPDAVHPVGSGLGATRRAFKMSVTTTLVAGAPPSLMIEMVYGIVGAGLAPKLTVAAAILVITK